MLYPTKAGGETYVMPSTIPTRKGITPKYDSGRVMVLGDGGEFEQVIPGIVRLTQNNNVQLCFTTSKGYATSEITTDRDALIQSRFMQTIKDWHNIEFTVSIKYLGGNDSGAITLGTRGGLGVLDPCQGFQYKAGINLNASGGFFAKQQYSTSGNEYREFNTTKMGSSIKGKFVAIKFVIYDLDHEGNPTTVSEDAETVKMEVYGTSDGSSPFRIIKETVDDGNWGQAAVCGGQAGVIGLWGGPISTLEWRDGADIQIQSISIREIDPLANFDDIPQLGSISFTPPEDPPVEPVPEPAITGYEFEYKFGKNGSGDGQFLDPHDASFDSSGNVFVSDRNRNDVQKFTHEGVFISKFGGPGSGNAQFNVPYAIQHSPSGDIYVCDRDNDRVQRLSSAGAYISQITTVNGQALNAPEDICFVSNGDMFISDTGNNRIVKLNSSHAFILEWGQKGSGNGEFDHPHSMDIGPDGNIYISSGNQPYIQVFTLTGTFIRKWGSYGRNDGQLLTFLEHLDIQGERLHIVNNDARPIVTVFDLQGNFLTKYGKETKGSANGQFNEAEHVTVDSNGHPFVIDAGNQRVQVFKPIITASTQATTVTATTAVSTQAVGQVNDSLGVQQIYKTKPGGSVWVSTKDGLLSDKQFSDNNYTIKSIGNGVYNVPGKSRIQSFSTKEAGSKGPDFDGYATHDFEELRKRGAWDSTTTDWRDVEMTAYIKMKGSGGSDSPSGQGDEVSWVVRSVRHNGASHSGCGGSSYHGNLHVTGHGRFKKEDYHVSYQNDGLLDKDFGRVNGKTVGFKFVLYNINENKAVKLELYIDVNNNNTWEFMGEKIDAGDWTTNGPDMKHCGATSNTAIISWGSPKVVWKWNDPLEVDISKMSVREIIPEKEDGTTPPGGGTGGGDPPATGGTGQLSRIQSTFEGIYDVIVDSSGNTCAGAAPPSGTGVYNEVTALTVTTITNDKQLAASWGTENDRDRVGWTCEVSDAEIHGIRPTKVGVYLKKVGSPTGNASVIMRDSSDNIKVTYGTIDVSTLTTGYVLHEDEFIEDNAATLMGQGFANKWKLCVEYNDVSSNSSNHICVGVNYNNPIDGIKTYEIQHEKEPGPGYSYVKHTDRDMCGKLYTSPA